MARQPSATGASTTWQVEAKSAKPSTAMYEPASSEMTSGVATTAASVEAVVMRMERAISPRAMKATMLEACAVRV